MDLNTALQQVGEGWHSLVQKFYEFVEVIDCACDADRKDPVKISSVEISRGMLKIIATHEHSTVQEILDKLAWAIERDSCVVCEICGKRGFRRKALPGSPNRCKPHYIELANEMAEKGMI